MSEVTRRWRTTKHDRSDGSFDFVIRTAEGAVRIVTFYERTRPAALALARTWAKHAEQEILGESEDETA